MVSAAPWDGGADSLCLCSGRAAGGAALDELGDDHDGREAGSCKISPDPGKDETDAAGAE